ncbi:24394_t:CDS:2 [Gigaspora margarita]|uniref:24394_t:CDS:1 n=1 Tax=Gigaspora margarita TaxID=4874 RepID=A0ABM8VW77_GIGMA|nr:24394_t:CDS:2 [Gigaspora margarita]
MLELKMKNRKVREDVRQIDRNVLKDNKRKYSILDVVKRGIRDRYRGYYFEVMLEGALASEEESNSPLMMLEDGVGGGST